MDCRTERYHLLWAVDRSARYHSRRQAFFERWHRVTAALGVFFGTSAAATALNGPMHIWAVIPALIVAVASTFDLVVGTATMARTHAELRRRFLMLQVKIERSSEAPAQSEIQEWTSERLIIEADEPPIYVALDLLCENEVAKARGDELAKSGTDAKRAAVTRWQSLTAQWLHWQSLPEV